MDKRIEIEWGCTVPWKSRIGQLSLEESEPKTEFSFREADKTCWDAIRRFCSVTKCAPIPSSDYTELGPRHCEIAQQAVKCFESHHWADWRRVKLFARDLDLSLSGYMLRRALGDAPRALGIGAVTFAVGYLIKVCIWGGTGVVGGGLGALGGLTCWAFLNKFALEHDNHLFYNWKKEQLNCYKASKRVFERAMDERNRRVANAEHERRTQTTVNFITGLLHRYNN